MTKLSVNINKIATLRNARGGNVPNVLLRPWLANVLERRRGPQEARSGHSPLCSRFWVAILLILTESFLMMDMLFYKVSFFVQRFSGQIKF